MEFELSPEKIAAFNEQQQESVRKLYGNWYKSPLHYLLAAGKWSSSIAGAWANSRISKRFVPRFVKKYSINTDEMESPVASFKTFNEFFTRKLKEGARTFSSDPYAVVSPADGTIFAKQNISEGMEFPIKGAKLSIKKMLNDDQLAKQFHGGKALVVRLAPWDYHRLHFPLAGVPSAANVFRGKYESVHQFAYETGLQQL